MIKENTEPKDEQISSSNTLITSPATTINHAVQQRTNNHKWKQISLQGLDISPQQIHLTSPNKVSTPPLNSAAQRVRHTNLFHINHSSFSFLLKSLRRTATVIHPNTMTTSSITNDPRRTMPCNDITLPNNSNQTNSFFRRRTQREQQHSTPVNGQLEKSSSSGKSSLIDDNINKIPSTTFSLLRHHSSPTNPHTKIEKSTYDNLTNATLHTDNTITSTSNLERKSSYPFNHKKSHRHVTNESLKSDAYDNYPEKNGYDNYPLVRKNDLEGKNRQNRCLRLSFIH